MNHFATLGAHRQMTPDEIRDLYYAIAKATHPDVHGPSEVFAEATKAWRAVGTITNRRAYEKYLDTVGDRCEDCDGTGAVRHQPTLHDVTFTTCPTCEGCGVVNQP